MTNPWMKILKVKEDKTTSANDLPIKAAEVANKLLEAQYFTAHDS